MSQKITTDSIQFDFNAQKSNNPGYMHADQTPGLARDPLSPDDENRLISVLPSFSNRDQALIFIGLYAGVKAKECGSLKISDVLNENNEVKDSINLNSRTVFLNDSVKKSIKRYIEGRRDCITPESPLFRSLKNKGISTWQINRIIHQAVNQANCSGDLKIGSNSLRKSFAHKIFQASNKDLELTRIALGHASISYTKKLLNLKTEEADSKIRSACLAIDSNAIRDRPQTMQTSTNLDPEVTRQGDFVAEKKEANIGSSEVISPCIIEKGGAFIAEVIKEVVSKKKTEDDISRSQKTNMETEKSTQSEVTLSNPNEMADKVKSLLMSGKKACEIESCLNITHKKLIEIERGLIEHLTSEGFDDIHIAKLLNLNKGVVVSIKKGIKNRVLNQAKIAQPLIQEASTPALNKAGVDPISVTQHNNSTKEIISIKYLVDLSLKYLEAIYKAKNESFTIGFKWNKGREVYQGVARFDKYVFIIESVEMVLLEDNFKADDEKINNGMLQICKHIVNAKRKMVLSMPYIPKQGNKRGRPFGTGLCQLAKKLKLEVVKEYRKNAIIGNDETVQLSVVPVSVKPVIADETELKYVLNEKLLLSNQREVIINSPLDITINEFSRIKKWVELIFNLGKEGNTTEADVYKLQLINKRFFIINAPENINLKELERICRWLEVLLIIE